MSADDFSTVLGWHTRLHGCTGPVSNYLVCGIWRSIGYHSNVNHTPLTRPNREFKRGTHILLSYTCCSDLFKTQYLVYQQLKPINSICIVICVISSGGLTFNRTTVPIMCTVWLAQVNNTMIFVMHNNYVIMFVYLNTSRCFTELGTVLGIVWAGATSDWLAWITWLELKWHWVCLWVHSILLCQHCNNLLIEIIINYFKDNYN